MMRLPPATITAASGTSQVPCFAHPGLEDEIGGLAVDGAVAVIAAVAQFPGGLFDFEARQPLIGPFYRQAESAVQAPTEFVGPGADRARRAVHIQRVTDDQKIGLPLLQ